METQEQLPKQYTQLTHPELRRRIAERKDQLGPSLCILGHHYQRDEVIEFADFTGDSLKLSQLAAERKEAKYIVFCGVHFMAESADVLSGPHQAVILPNLQAGCPLADTADQSAVAAAIDELGSMTSTKVVPITYVNSAAALKAITARAGGACCTSSNVANVFAWAFRSTDEGGAGAEKILAIPDAHLGRNTAVAMGYSPADCVVYDPGLPNGGLSQKSLAPATFILWKGQCYVHQRFTVEHVRLARQAQPGVTVIVHPECRHEVVKLADASGSTEQIIRAVAGGQGQESWAIGTESNLVNRLAKQHPQCTIRVLSDEPSHCAQMARIDLPHLLWALDGLCEGRVVNRISVPEETAAEARTALQRMIEIKGAADVTRRR